MPKIGVPSAAAKVNSMQPQKTSSLPTSVIFFSYWNSYSACCVRYLFCDSNSALELAEMDPNLGASLPNDVGYGEGKNVVLFYKKQYDLVCSYGRRI